MISQAFYANARERLVGVTDDSAILDAFDRLTERAAEGDDERTDEALGVFLREVQRLGLSLDYIFIGSGKPHTSWQAATG